jgi:polygalacturonase
MKKLLLFICCVAILFTAQAQDYVITSYGVSADSTKLNTKAIQNVIDRAHKKGGGTIVIPKGVFLTGALFFKPNTKLRLSEGAVLKGSDDISNYPLIPSRMEGRKLDYYAALINAYNVNNFTITGPGTINGNGYRFWTAFWAYRDSMRKIGKEATNLEVHRPRLLFIWGCNNVKIQNVNLRNSGFWTTHLYQCNNVLIENCDIRSPYKPVPAPSTDGIDIDVCKKVTVRNCYISVNDDAVCIKGGKGPDAHKRPENGIVEDILVENCTFGESHGTLTLGSESIHARNITMRNCKVENNCPILRLKMRPDTYQTYENITIENITGKCGTIISMNPWKQFFDMGGSTEKPFATVRNITMSNIKVSCKSFGELQGNPSDTVSNIVFKNIEATAESPALKTKYSDIKTENVIVNGSPMAKN